ncbi:Low affinity ammonium transporter [Cladobotryum mycophilum]|uniref:Low affinity ammonium transporter n=1 Tax=Cladobotryum mycophilum TaxID=491253 RepID=A0ABR0SWZ1_9HYPO
MGVPTLPSVQETGILSSRTSSSEDRPIYYDKTEIERLGRERPAALPNWYVEIGFVMTVVMSITMSEFFASQTWPAGVINLTTSSLLMVFSRACDIYGGRTVFLAGHAWLMIWSIICGFSQNYLMLIICRAMQGIGSAAFLPAGLSLLGQTYRPGPRKNKVFAIWGAFASVGFFCGIFIGAICSQYLTWRWYFWIGAIIVSVVVVTGWLTIPRHLHQNDPSIRMDWWGVFTIVPGLVLVVYAFTDGGHAPHGWKTPYIYVTFILGVLFLAAAFYVQGWVSARPLIPAALFKPNIQNVMHIGPLLMAAWFSPLAVGGMILSVGGGFVLHIIPNRILMLISCAGSIVTSLLFALIPEQVDGTPKTSFLYWAYIFPAMVCSTIGVDIALNTSNVFITTQMPRRHQAAASGLINSLLYLSLAFWLGIAETAVSEAVRAKGEAGLSPREQYKIGFWMSVGLAALALISMSTVQMGSASADLTADEKAALESEEASASD